MREGAAADPARLPIQGAAADPVRTAPDTLLLYYKPHRPNLPRPLPPSSGRLKPCLKWVAPKGVTAPP